LRFPGQYFDAETGLYYNYFRNYEPTTGRYVQSDSIGLSGGLNTYGYSYQNPILNIDPDGRFVWLVPPVYWAVGAASATAAVLVNNSILGNIPDNIYVPGFPDPIDPWKDTNTEERVPANILPPNRPEKCEKDYRRDRTKCNLQCSNTFSRNICMITARLKQLVCLAKKPKVDWDDFDDMGGDGPNYIGGFN
jgi:RHS repeat-associated protein